MIVTEYFEKDGRELVKTYSDTFHKIIQDGTGAVYDEAIDPVDSGRTYTESEEVIEIVSSEIE